MSQPSVAPEDVALPPADEAMGDPHRLARAHLSRVVEPGDTALAGEVAEHGWEGVVRRLHARRGPQRWVARHGALTTPTHRLVASVARLGVAVLVPGDVSWPAGLDVLEDADQGIVACLWVRGRLPPADTGSRRDLGGELRDQPETRLGMTRDRTVAIVGARACSPYGQHVASEMSCDLAAQGWTVVSGAAFGIDGAAHRGALAGAPDGDPSVSTARTVPTIAVLACGVDRAYPAGHAGLIDRIITAGGAVVSELPPGATPQRWRFLQRNRLIAAMSAATVVVEAAARSGAAGTARAAAVLGRPVGAVPGPVSAATSSGCHELIRDGIATLVRGTADVVELASPIGSDLGTPRRDDSGARPGAGLLTERVLACLSSSHSTGTAQAAVLAGLDVLDVRGVLLDLELAGSVARLDGGWVRSR